MNKKAEISMKIVGAVVIMIIVILSGIFIYSGILYRLSGSTTDAFCNVNVRVMEFPGAWVAEFTGTLIAGCGGMHNLFCHPDKNFIEVDSDVDCDDFINFKKDDKKFPLTECPYAIDNYYSLSKSAQNNFIQVNGKDFLEENCQYKKWCEDNINEPFMKKTYEEQQLAHLIERCIDISGKSKDVTVPCFLFQTKTISTGPDAYITLSQIQYVSQFTKSFHSKSETSFEASEIALEDIDVEGNENTCTSLGIPSEECSSYIFGDKYYINWEKNKEDVNTNLHFIERSEYHKQFPCA
jgi:hypothetical protein